MTHLDYLMQPNVLKAVFFAAVVFVAVGLVWYSPKAFGNLWLKMSGVKSKKTDMGRAYIGMILSALLLSATMACFMVRLNISDYTDGLLLGFKVWLGFVVPFTICGVLWSGQPFKLFALETSCNLLQLLAVGAVLSYLI